MSRSVSPRWWEEDGLVVAGGWHPITARLRRGIPPEDLEELYAWEYSEEHILWLKELGITLLISQFDRGLGDSDQADDQQLTREQVERCHRHGIHHGCYIANTVYHESVLKDNPECEDWAVKTYDDRFVHYGGLQTFRWVGCFNSPGWRERTRRQLKRAIEFVGTDALHLDSMVVWPEPDSCHCHYCQRAFRGFLQRRYPTAEAQKRRFGFTGFKTFRAPNFYTRFVPPWNVDRIDNPLHQEWVEFRMWTVTEYLRDLSDYARGLNPDICIMVNGQSVFGFNQAFIYGTDHEAQLALVDVCADENPDIRPDVEAGAVYPSTHRFRGGKLLRQLGKPSLGAYRNEETLAANLTFSGSPGINSHWGYSEPGRKPLRPHQDGVKELLDHFHRHRQLYLNTRPAAKVAVWRSRKSLAFISTDTHLSACVMEQLLFRAGVPFTIIMDGALEAEALEKLDLVICPNVEFIDEKQVDRLSNYVCAGGGLLITERTGQFTGEPRQRRMPAFAHLFEQTPCNISTDETEAATIDSNTQFVDKENPGRPGFANYGGGRVVYLPHIEYVHSPRSFKSNYNVYYDGIDSRYWKEPRNHRQILGAVDWLAPTARDVMVVAAGPELRTDLVKTAGGELALTLMRCGELDGPRDLVLSVRDSDRLDKPARLYLPHFNDPLVLEWQTRPGRAETILPGLLRHGVVVL